MGSKEFIREALRSGLGEAQATAVTSLLLMLSMGTLRAFDWTLGWWEARL